MERIKRLASYMPKSCSHHTHKAMSCTIRIALKVPTKVNGYQGTLYLVDRDNSAKAMSRLAIMWKDHSEDVEAIRRCLKPEENPTNAGIASMCRGHM